MSAEKDWLAMLDKATNYADLQVAFSRMNAESQSTADSEAAKDAMVASIDEAIRRIELERTRDQSELDGVSSDYETFKQEQSGVIGWFKRKLPFTETRKQELGHREALNDQMAEILADNFVIARAQMLKERIASPKSRRMGHQSAYWRAQFQSNESVNSIDKYGRVVADLGKELSVAKLFVETVQVDIDAFSEAKFVSKDDQLRSAQDLEVAQAELQALVDESQEKANLRGSALATLKGLLIRELSEKDNDFKNTVQRLSLLTSLEEKRPHLAKAVDVRLKNVKVLIAKMVERDSLPEQRDKLESAIQKLKRDWDEAERNRLKLVSELEGPSQVYNAAATESQQAKAALNASKPLYDAYLAEQNRNLQSTGEVTSESDFAAASSNVVAEFRRLEEAATVAAQRLSQAAGPFEQVKRAVDDAVSQAKSIHDKLEAQSLELKKITTLESELQQKLLKAKQGIESTLPELRTAASSFVDIARQITWIDTSGESIRTIQAILDDHSSWGSSASSFSQVRFPASFPTHSSATKDSTEWQRQSEHLERATQAIESFRKTSVQETAKLAKLRKEALQRRGQMLLDQSVLSELDLD